MSKVSWLFGTLQEYGVDTKGMDLDTAFAELEKLRKSGKITDDEINARKNHANEQKSNVGKDRKSQATADNTTSIKEQIQANKEKLKNTKVLVNIPKGKMTTKFDVAATTLRTKLAKNNGVVKREGFGEIQVSKRIFEAKKYAKTPEEIAAIAAIPKVLEKGVEIDSHENHKNRGYKTVTFAGKVTIGGKSGILGVAIKQTKGNFYEAHRVLLPNGQTIEI